MKSSIKLRVPPRKSLEEQVIDLETTVNREVDRIARIRSLLRNCPDPVYVRNVTVEVDELERKLMYGLDPLIVKS